MEIRISKTELFNKKKKHEIKDIDKNISLLEELFGIKYNELQKSL